MAEKSSATQPMVVLSPAQAAAREIAEQQKALAESGVKLDEASRPGGYFIGTDGQPHDAEGRPIKETKAEAKAEAEDDEPEGAAAKKGARGKK